MDLMTLAISLIAVLGLLWAVYFVFERDAEEATQRFADRVFGTATGAVIAFTVLVGEAIAFVAIIVETIMGVPSLIIALIGLGGLGGSPEMSPGIFAIVAIAVFLASRAVTR